MSEAVERPVEPAEEAAGLRRDRVEQRREQVTGTGFLALGSLTLNAGGGEPYLLDQIDDQIDVTTRGFLALSVACARCHDHPFDRWTQEDFREFSRFFEGLERSEVSPGNTRLSEPTRSGDEPAPRFLTGAQPKTGRWRAELAYFLTRSKPFARNFANRIWYHLFGIGIVDPPDDVHAENPAIAPELLILSGRHRFSEYSLEWRIVGLPDERSQLSALTRAQFPGVKGRAYKALVIDSGAHARITRRMLGSVARQASRG